MKLSLSDKMKLRDQVREECNRLGAWDSLTRVSVTLDLAAALTQQAQVIPVEEIRISPETIAAAEAAYNFDATIQPAEQSQPLTDDAVKDLAWRLQAAYHESGKDWNTAARCALGDHPLVQQAQPEPECSQCGNTKNVGPEYHICRACAEPVTYYPENCAACKFIEQTRSQLAMAEKHGVHRDSCPHNQ